VTDARLRAPAAERNREPIRAVLQDVLPPRGTVLEIASGTGEHAVFFAAAFPSLVFAPSDPDPEARASIDAWRVASGLPNVEPARALDVLDPDWIERAPAADAIVCINLVHISPWEATEGLLAGAGRLLAGDAPLVLYGPYRREGRHTAPSNAAFDASLRARDPRFGVRDLEAVEALARGHGLVLERVVEMPANNLVVVLRRRAGGREGR
jgi:hypothetical protein